MSKGEFEYQTIAEALTLDGAIASQMFGMPTLKIKGKAFAGLASDAMVFKLSGEPHKRALATTGAKLFEPMEGRPMKEWVVVPVAASKQWLEFARDALVYVAAIKK